MSSRFPARKITHISLDAAVDGEAGPAVRCDDEPRRGRRPRVVGAHRAVAARDVDLRRVVGAPGRRRRPGAPEGRRDVDRERGLGGRGDVVEAECSAVERRERVRRAVVPRRPGEGPAGPRRRRARERAQVPRRDGVARGGAVGPAAVVARVRDGPPQRGLVPAEHARALAVAERVVRRALAELGGVQRPDRRVGPAAAARERRRVRRRRREGEDLAGVGDAADAAEAVRLLVEVEHLHLVLLAGAARAEHEAVLRRVGGHGRQAAAARELGCGVGRRRRGEHGCFGGCG